MTGARTHRRVAVLSDIHGNIDEAVRRYRATDDPSVEQMVELLLSPPTREELIADAEARVFAG